MKQTLLITELNKEDNLDLNNLVLKYVELKKEIADRENELLAITKEIEQFKVDTIGLQSENVRLTITPSKVVKKIDYEQTLLCYDVKEFKKEKVSMVWNDAKIEEELKDKVVYEDTITKARVLVKPLMKEGE